MDFENVFQILVDISVDAINLSITAGWIVLAVIVLRLLLRKSPRWISCLLWGLVGIRLIFPFSISSVFSLIPSKETFDPDTVYSNKFTVNTGFDTVDHAVNSYMGDKYYEGVTVPYNFKFDLMSVFTIVWIVGIVLLLVYFIVSFLKLKLKLRTATKLEDNIFQSSFAQSPFVFGFFRPKIYIPYSIEGDSLEFVISHEKAHISRRDHVIKPFAFLILCFYWFNPLLWIAYVLLCRDIESACDEKVIKDLNEDDRREYSRALLNLSVNKKVISACPLAFGEAGVKDRIKGVMSYKKPAFWIIIVSLVVCIVSTVCFLTDPVNKNNTQSINITEKLDDAISAAIIENNQYKYMGGYPCEAHRVLASEVGGPINDDKIEYTTVEVFLIADYSEYSIENGELIQSAGMRSPLAIVFEVDKNENYTLLEYWEPGMGSDFIKSLETRFPKGVDFLTDDFDDDLRNECEAKAREHFGVSETGYNKVYTLSPTEMTLSSSFLPKVSLNENDKTFMFVYDLLSSYLPTGTFEMENDEVVAETSDGKYRFVFRIINNKEIRFDKKKSSSLIVTNKDLSYQLEHGDVFILGEPERSSGTEFTTVVQIIGEEFTTKPDPILPYTENFRDYSLTIAESAEEKIWRMSDEEFRQKNGYSVFGYSIDGAYVEIGDRTVSLTEGLKRGLIGADGIVEKARQDTKYGTSRAMTYKDGGSTLYVYDDYAIIKLNRIEGGRKDLFIGPSDMTLNYLTPFFEDIY